MVLKFPWGEPARKGGLVDLHSHHTNSWHSARVLDVVEDSSEIRCVYIDGPGRGKMLWISVHHEPRLAKHGTHPTDEKLIPWVCKECSMENDAEKDSCGMCYSKKSGSDSAKPESVSNTHPLAFRPASKSEQYCETCRQEFNTAREMCRCDSCGITVCKNCCTLRDPTQNANGRQVPMCHTCNLSSNCVLPRCGLGKSRNINRRRRAGSDPDVSAVMGVRRPRALLKKHRRQNTEPEIVISSVLTPKTPPSHLIKTKAVLPDGTHKVGSIGAKSVQVPSDQKVSSPNDKKHFISDSATQASSDQGVAPRTHTSDTKTTATPNTASAQPADQKLPQTLAGKDTKCTPNTEVDDQNVPPAGVRQNTPNNERDRDRTLDVLKLVDKRRPGTGSGLSRTCAMRQSPERLRLLAAKDVRIKLGAPKCETELETSIAKPTRGSTVRRQLHNAWRKDPQAQHVPRHFRRLKTPQTTLDKADREYLTSYFDNIHKEILSSKNSAAGHHESVVSALERISVAMLENQPSVKNVPHCHNCEKIVSALSDKIEALSLRSESDQHEMRTMAKSIQNILDEKLVTVPEPPVATRSSQLLEVNDSHDFLKGLTFGAMSGFVALLACWLGQ